MHSSDFFVLQMGQTHECDVIVLIRISWKVWHLPRPVQMCLSCVKNRVVFCVFSQMRRVAQVGVDGVWRVDWHDYEAIRKDAARTGQSTTIMLRNIYFCGHTCTRT